MVKRQNIGENQNKSSILAKKEGCYIKQAYTLYNFYFLYQ